MTRLTAAFICFIASSTADASVALEHRADVKNQLHQLLCQPTVNLDAKTTIGLGIYDAQIDARIVESVAGSTINERTLAKKSKALAAMKRYHGYTQGVCSDRKGWVAALPAPAPLIKTKTGFELKKALLKMACQSHRMDFAAFSGGSSQPVTSLSETNSLGEGMIEITCQPSFPRWQGPIVWYLAPSKAESIFSSPTVPKSPDPVASLTQWFSALRAKEKLPPIIANDSLGRAAELLTIDTSITHNRANTGSLKEKIAVTDNLKIIGELRARGQTVEDIAWMIWHSPRHRDLVLSKEATNFGLVVKEVGTEFLAVCLSAQELRPITASSGKKKAAK